MSIDNFMDQIDEERLIREFQELTAIDSVSFKERKMADALKEKFAGLGILLQEDDAGGIYRSEAGNLYGYVPGTLTGPPLLFSAHMDTVEPGIGKRAVLQEDGRIVSGGDTVLGADDMAGMAAILEALRLLKEKGIPHRDIELLFPVAEESYVKGSSVFDYGNLKAKEAYVLDLSGPVGRASLREPTLISFKARVRGRAAHAGFAPEKGIHAIAAAALAVTEIPQGRIGDNTTVNIGKICGGEATNIVPEFAEVEGEIRSYVHEEALAQMERVREAFERAAGQTGAQVQVEDEVHLKAYQIKKEEPVVKRFERVCAGLGLVGGLTETFGGSDNNSFLRHGIRGIVLACGMNQVHTTQEYTTVEELKRCSAIVAGLMTDEEEK